MEDNTTFATSTPSEPQSTGLAAASPGGRPEEATKASDADGVAARKRDALGT